MTESEFDRRLALVLGASPGAAGIGDLEGFADLFGAIKNVVVKAGSGLASAAGKLATGATGLLKGAGSAVASIGRGLTSEGGATLLSTAGQFVVAKQAAKIEENKIALQTALVNQGYYPTSSDAQSLLNDVAREGIVNANGRVLVPGVDRNMRSGFDLSQYTPYILGGAGLLGLLFVLRSSPRH